MDTDVRTALSDPRVLAALYKARLPADEAGLIALKKLDDAKQKAPANTPILTSSQQDTPVNLSTPTHAPPKESHHSVGSTMNPSSNVSPGVAHFVRGDFEYRLVADTRNIYEYNRIRAMRPGAQPSPLFSEGGVADGYIMLGDDGGFSRQPVSYAVLDEHIERDRKLIGASFDVPVAERDYHYYVRADTALRALDRIWVSPDEKTVEVINGGRRWRIVLLKGFRVIDRADKMLFPRADVSTPGRFYSGVEISIDASKREVSLFDRESGIGRVGTLPHEELADITTGMAEKSPIGGTDQSSSAAMKIHVTSMTPPSRAVPIPSPSPAAGSENHAIPAPFSSPTTPTANALATPSRTEGGPFASPDVNVPPKTTQSDSVAIAPNSTVNETSDKHIPSSYNASAVQKIPVESLTHRAVSNEGIAGRLRMLSETGRDDGSVERVFALPFGKALLAISYSANNEIRQIAVKSNDFMYPGGELLPEWESLLLRKRRSVGQFSQSDEEQDILAAKRIIVQRARERMLYRSVLKTLEDESAEHEAVTAQMHEIEREMTERYGNLFSLHV